MRIIFSFDGNFFCVWSSSLGIGVTMVTPLNPITPVAPRYEPNLHRGGVMALADLMNTIEMLLPPHNSRETSKFGGPLNRVERDKWFTVQEETEHWPTRLNTIIVEGRPERKMEVIVGARAQLDVRRNFFTMRVEKGWNKLPEEVKAQRSVNGFKNHYDRWREQSVLLEEIS